MSRTQRWLVPAGGLLPLARSRDVPLPAAWALPSTPLDEPLLGRLEVLPDAAELTPWRTPVVIVRLLLAALGEARAVPSEGPAAALEAHLTVGAEGLVGLVRRDGVGLVELTTAPAAALPEELDRVLDVLGREAGVGAARRCSRALFEAGSGSGPVAEVLHAATRVLEATVSGVSGALTGGLWYDAAGWWRVELVGADVELRPCAPRVSDWAPLLDQVLA